MAAITNGLLVLDVVPFEEEDESPFVGCSKSKRRDLVRFAPGGRAWALAAA